MLGCQFLAAVQLVLLTCMLPIVYAQESPARPMPNLLPSNPAAPTGLLTDRLSAKELERWRAIERLVFTEDNERQPLHPTLRWMWEWIETSGHAVYIEVIRMNRTSTCTAGNFSIERYDPRGEMHVAVIRINLPNIDQAYVGPNAARTDGFIPFGELNKEERYAEVLGHEMAHAVHILTNPQRTQMVFELVERTNEKLLSQHVRKKSGAIDPDLKNNLSRRDALLKELEAQAESMEKVVWKELVGSKPVREKLATALPK